MTTTQQIAATITKLEHALAVAIMRGDKASDAKFSRALESILNKTDFPKVSA